MMLWPMVRYLIDNFSLCMNVVSDDGYVNWLTIHILLLEETNIHFPITDFIMTYGSTVFLHVLLTFGIVYLTMLSMLILLTFLKHA